MIMNSIIIMVSTVTSAPICSVMHPIVTSGRSYLLLPNFSSIRSEAILRTWCMKLSILRTLTTYNKESINDDAIHVTGVPLISVLGLICRHDRTNRKNTMIVYNYYEYAHRNEFYQPNNAHHIQAIQLFSYRPPLLMDNNTDGKGALPVIHEIIRRPTLAFSILIPMATISPLCSWR